MKLFTVRIIIEGIVLAESAEEARFHADDIKDTEDLNTVEVDEGEMVRRKWSPQALVYGDHDTDMTLAEARKLVAGE